MFSNLSCANEAIMAKSFEIENDEFEILVTRASSYEKSVLGLEEKPDNIRSKSSERNKFFFLCKSHDDSKLWSTAINNPCPNCLNFEVTNSLPAGKLPTKLQVICFIITQKKLNVLVGRLLPVILHCIGSSVIFTQRVYQLLQRNWKNATKSVLV